MAARSDESKKAASLAKQTDKQKMEHLKMLSQKSQASMEIEKSKELARQEWSPPRKFLDWLLHNHWFEGGCGLVILFNLVLVVIETDAGSQSNGESPGWVTIMTKLLLAFYTTELGCKMFVTRLEFFCEIWNLLDFVIVGIDLVLFFVGLFVDKLPSVAILRIFRLIRLARAFKAATFLHELNNLLRACTCALKAIFWGMIMMCLTLTIWGILAVQLLHPVNKRVAEKGHYDGCERCPHAFATVFDSALTFWTQIVAGDAWGQVSVPVIEEAPWTSLIFMAVMVTVSLTMLNCILAVVVEAGARAAAADEHQKSLQMQKDVQKAEAKLIDLCEGLDVDSGGSLNIHEFMNGFHNNDNFRECMEVMNVTETDMQMIFNICDEDDSGDVDYREFVEQLRRIKNSGEQMLLHYVTDIRHVVNKLRPECFKHVSEHEHKHKEEKLAEGALNPNETPAKTDPDNEKTGPETETTDFVAILEGKDPGEQAKKAEPLVDIESKEKIERIWQINEGLSTAMSDVAEQSKVQTGLLNTLVRDFNASGVTRSSREKNGGESSRKNNIAEELEGDANGQAAGADLVELRTAAADSSRANARTETTCCVRLV